MNLVVVGAGAMGSLYGGSLKHAFPDWNISLVDVWKEHVSAINERGLNMERHGKIDIVRLLACSPAEVKGHISTPVDLIIVFTKTMHTESALDSVRFLIGPKTMMMTLQNGLGNIERLERFAPQDRIIVGVTTNPCDLIGPGKVRMTGRGDTKIMTASGKSAPILEEISSALTKTGLTCSLEPNILGIIWEKAAFNVCLNGLTCVTRLTVGGVGASQEGRELCKSILDEIDAVACKKRINFSTERVWNTVLMAFSEHQKHMPSMLQDRLAKRKTEVESIQGCIIQSGQEVGVPTPFTHMLYQLIRIVEQAYDWEI